MSETWHPGVNVSELTNVGMRRSNNQDAYAVMVAESEDRFRRRGHLFVVADGMGAHAAGELASKIASEQIAMRYLGSQKTDMDLALVEAVHHANTAIFERGQSNPEFHNMGTTASSLVLADGKAYVAHVGDSRVYRQRGDRLEQLTFDHSLVWEMQASGQLHDDSPLHKAIPKNVITRSLGPAAYVLVDLEGPSDIQLGDRFLLCSDGLTGLVEDEELAVLLHSVPLSELAPFLVDLANLRGGPDNITVVLVEVTGEHLASTSPIKPSPRQTARNQDNSSRALLGTTIVSWLVALLLGLGILLGNRSLYGSMIVAFILGAIALGFWLSGIFGPTDKRPALKPRSGPMPTGGLGQDGQYESGLDKSEVALGTGPYRTYQAKAYRQLLEDLQTLVNELKQTSERNLWTLDWGKVDELSERCRGLINQNKWKAAVAVQSQAVIEAMALLKQHQDDSAGETSVDL